MCSLFTCERSNRYSWILTQLVTLTSRIYVFIGPVTCSLLWPNCPLARASLGIERNVASQAAKLCAPKCVRQHIMPSFQSMCCCIGTLPALSLCVPTHTHAYMENLFMSFLYAASGPAAAAAAAACPMAARNFTQLLEKLQKIENVRERINFYCVTCNAKLLLFMASCV